MRAVKLRMKRTTDLDKCLAEFDDKCIRELLETAMTQLVEQGFTHILYLYEYRPRHPFTGEPLNTVEYYARVARIVEQG